MFTSITSYAKFSAILFGSVLVACAPQDSNKDSNVPKIVELSPRLHRLFSETKIVCFGRYVLRVPMEAQLIWGNVGFPSDVDVIVGGASAVDEHIGDYIAKLKWADNTAEVTYNGEGPIPGSRQLRYYESETAKKYGLYFFSTYVTKGDLTFILGGSLDGETEESAIARHTTRIRSLRLLENEEIPAEPGYCIERAFISDNTYNGQETVEVGIYLPSVPDVAFSVSSNKDAYSDYPAEEFENVLRIELSLLARIRKAQDDQGVHYPRRTVLREGKRNVQNWKGEESLIRRDDGVHDFEWALVGTPKDVANPPEFNVRMFTKVEHNTVGAAKNTSLNDDEALALWDKLLSEFKFRVKVPKALEGSYMTPPG